jgi:hypothetical protein
MEQCSALDRCRATATDEIGWTREPPESARDPNRLEIAMPSAELADLMGKALDS